jgi:hypothetical protein
MMGGPDCASDGKEASVRTSFPRHYTRAFRPMFLWGLASALLLTWDVYRKSTLTFLIVADWGSVSRANISVDGDSFSSGGRIRPGRRTIKVTAPDMEPFETNVFLWIGQTDLGEFGLTRSKGDLEIVADPVEPEQIEISGEFFRTNITAGELKFPQLPIGEYEIRAHFGVLTEQERVRIERGRRTRVSFRPEVGWVSIEGNPLPASVSLSPVSFAGKTIGGELPIRDTLIKAGDYEVTATRGDYVLKSRVSVRRGETNQLSMAFVYGAFDFDIDPPGATVTANGKLLGKAPFQSKEVIPGRYLVEVAKEGFAPVSIQADIEPNSSVVIKTNLVNRAYANAMRESEGFLSGFTKDYKGALQSLERALEAQPGDARALKAKAQLEEERKMAEAKETADKKLAFENAMKLFLKERFKAETISLKDEHLFETHFWECSRSLAAFGSALKRLIAQEGADWELKDEHKINPYTSRFRISGKGPIRKYRHLVLVAGEVSPNQTEIYVKFWDYVLSNNIRLNLSEGIAPESLLPVHSAHIRDADQRMLILVREFKEKLFRELK